MPLCVTSRLLQYGSVALKVRLPKEDNMYGTFVGATKQLNHDKKQEELRLCQEQIVRIEKYKEKWKKMQ